MIELDEERREKLRSSEWNNSKVQEHEDLQIIRFTGLPKSELQSVEDGIPETDMLTQRAVWNGAWSGDAISGTVVFDEQNAFGALPMDNLEGKFVLVRRGGPTPARMTLPRRLCGF